MKPQSTGIRFPILLPKTNSIKYATSANQRLCICFAAAKYRANTRARKLAVTKSKRLMLLHILKREKYFPNPIPHRQISTRGNYTVKMSTEAPEQVLENMKLYYAELFSQYPDMMTTTEISKVIGYGTTSINNCAGKDILNHSRETI